MPNIFPGGRVRADPRGQDQLIPLGCAHAKNHETLVCVKFVVFWGRVRADPRRQDQLVPMGCANAKIMTPWFAPNIFQGDRVGADPRRQDQFAPLGCAHTKNHETLVRVKFILFLGMVRADPRTQDQLVPMGCVKFVPNIYSRGQGTS